MKFRIIFLLTVCCPLLFNSCKKDKTDLDPVVYNYFIKYKINGVQKTYQVEKINSYYEFQELVSVQLPYSSYFDGLRIDFEHFTNSSVTADDILDMAGDTIPYRYESVNTGICVNLAEYSSGNGRYSYTTINDGSTGSYFVVDKATAKGQDSQGRYHVLIEARFEGVVEQGIDDLYNITDGSCKVEFAVENP